MLLMPETWSLLGPMSKSDWYEPVTGGSDSNAAAIKHTCVLLDTCYTNSVSNNTDLVKQIITCKNHKKITVSTNGGLKSFDKNTALNLFPTNVHFNQKSMATIL